MFRLGISPSSTFVRNDRSPRSGAPYRQSAAAVLAAASLSFAAVLAVPAEALAGSCYSYCGGDNQVACPLPCAGCDAGNHYDVDSAHCRATCVPAWANGRDDGYSCDSYALSSPGCGEAGDRSCSDAPYCESWAPYSAATTHCELPIGCATRPSVSATKPGSGRDVTFLVGTDLHAGRGTNAVDPTLEHSIHMLNSIGGAGLHWPSGASTSSAGQLVNSPVAMVTTGDLLMDHFHWQLGLFRTYYEKEPTVPNEHLGIPLYVGLGNHDIDCTLSNCSLNRDTYLANMLDYVDKRMSPSQGCNIADSYDSSSKSYSWDWHGYHFVQMHDWAGSPGDWYSRSGGLTWLQNDLAANANKPVILFQHYNFHENWDAASWDPVTTHIATDNLWYAIHSYDVRAIFVGHSHVAQKTTWNGIPVFEGSHLGGDTTEDRNWKRGVFVVHITDNALDVGQLTWDGNTGADFHWNSTFIPPETDSYSDRRFMADVDGDGKDEFCRGIGDWASGSGALRCADATGVELPNSYDLQASLTKVASGYRWMADVDGDGKTDFCRAEETGGTTALVCARSTGTGLSDNSFVGNVSDWGTGADRWMVDFDGDGKADLCRLSGNYLKCLMSNGDGWRSPEVSAWMSDIGYSELRFMFDVNGDGKADYCRGTGEGSGPTSYLTCSLSTGTGLGSDTMTIIYDWGQWGRRWFTDVDGDGKADFCRATGNSSGAGSYLRCSALLGTGLPGDVMVQVPDWGDQAWIADTDGDGLGELVAYHSTSERLDTLSIAQDQTSLPFQLQNVMAGTCLHEDGGVSALYTTDYQYTCDLDDPRNLWTWVGTGEWRMLKNVAAGTCLNVVGASSALFTDVYQYTCDPSYDSNLWKWTDTGGAGRALISKVGTCLHVNGGLSAPFTDVYQYTCQANNLANNWIAETIPFQLENQMAGTCLHEDGGLPALYTTDYQYGCDQTNRANLWTWVGSGEWRMLKNVAAGTCLNVIGANASVFTDVYQYTCDPGYDSNLWKWTNTGGAGRALLSKVGTCLHVNGGLSAPFTDVYQYTCETNNHANNWTAEIAPWSAAAHRDFDATLQNASQDGVNRCLIFSGNGADTYPSRYLWGGGNNIDNGYCGFSSSAELLGSKQALWTFHSLGDNLYTIQNASADGTHNQCLIFSGNGTDASPSRYLWGGNDDNGTCGFASKADLLANKQAVWRLTNIEGNKFTLSNASQDGVNRCLIFGGNGTATNPTRYLWGGGNSNDNGYCGFASKADLLANKQAIWTLTIR